MNLNLTMENPLPNSFRKSNHSGNLGFNPAGSTLDKTSWPHIENNRRYNDGWYVYEKNSVRLVGQIYRITLTQTDVVIQLNFRMRQTLRISKTESGKNLLSWEWEVRPYNEFPCVVRIGRYDTYPVVNNMQRVIEIPMTDVGTCFLYPKEHIELLPEHENLLPVPPYLTCFRTELFYSSLRRAELFPWNPSIAAPLFCEFASYSYEQDTLHSEEVVRDVGCVRDLIPYFDDTPYVTVFLKRYVRESFRYAVRLYMGEGT
jgi:hypothetical protein